MTESSPRKLDPAFLLTIAVISLLLLVPKIFQHMAGHTGDLDTGNYSHLAWGIVHGEGFSGTVLGRNNLGEHFSPIMALVAPIYVLWPSAYVLMILQAAAVASAIALTLYFADRQMREAGGVVEQTFGVAATRARFAVTALLIVMLFIYPPLLATWSTQFQPIELGMPLVILAILLMHARRDVWLAIVIVLLLATRESAPLTVAGLAIYAALALRRWKLAIVLLAAAGIWFALTMGILMPYFRAHERWGHQRWFGPGQMWDLKWRYLATMILGLGPLPLLGRRACAATVAAIPGMALNLAVARETQLTFVGHYDAQTAPFLMIAAAHGAAVLCAMLVDPRRRTLGLVACIGAVAASATLFGISEAKSPFQRIADWYPTPRDLAVTREVRAVGALFPDAPAMAGWAFFGPQICHRPHYMAIRTGDSADIWTDWASKRLEPGTILIVPTPEFQDGREKPERRFIRTSGHALLAHRGKMVEAWQWPSDAPRAGTAEALAYVKSGIAAGATTTATTRTVTQPTPPRKRRR